MKSFMPKFLRKIIVISVWSLALPAMAGEHGGQEHGGKAAGKKKGTEHPGKAAPAKTGGSGSEHGGKEHGGKKASVRATPEMHDAVKKYVAAKSKGGSFKIRDPKTKKVVALELVTLHDEVKKVKGGLYKSCAEFRTKGGGTYDLDFKLKKKGNGYQVTKMSVHKRAKK